MKPKIYPPYLTDTNVFDYWETWPSGFFCQRNHIDLQNHTKISKEILCFISILWLFFSLIRIRQFSSFQPGVGKRTGFSPIFGLGLKIDGRTGLELGVCGLDLYKIGLNRAEPGPIGLGTDSTFSARSGWLLKGPGSGMKISGPGHPLPTPAFNILFV